MSQNIPKRPKTSQNVPKRPKTSQNAIASWYGCIIFRTSWNLFENSDAINWFYCIMLWTSLNLAQPRPKLACLSQHNTAKRSKMSKNVPKRAKMPQNIPQNVPEHVMKKSRNTLKNSPGRPKLSKILQHKENRSWKSSTVQKCREFCRTNKIDPTFLHRPKMSGILQYK